MFKFAVCLVLGSAFVTFFSMTVQTHRLSAEPTVLSLPIAGVKLSRYGDRRIFPLRSLSGGSAIFAAIPRAVFLRDGRRFIRAKQRAADYRQLPTFCAVQFL